MANQLRIERHSNPPEHEETTPAGDMHSGVQRGGITDLLASQPSWGDIRSAFSAWSTSAKSTGEKRGPGKDTCKRYRVARTGSVSNRPKTRGKKSQRKRVSTKLPRGK